MKRQNLGCGQKLANVLIDGKHLEYVYGFYCTALYASMVFAIIKPSVCPSITCVYCDKTNESSTDILIPYERSIHLVFRHEEWLVGDVPLYLKFWAKLTPLLQKLRFQSIFARNASALRPSKKMQSSLIGSRLRAFQ